MTVLAKLPLPMHATSQPPATVVEPLSPALQLLARAEALLHAEGWTQGANARDKFGNRVPVASPAARLFSMTGAVDRICHLDPALKLARAELHAVLRRAVSAHIHQCSLREWQDQHGRTLDQVLYAMHLAYGILLLRLVDAQMEWTLPVRDRTKKSPNTKNA